MISFSDGPFDLVTRLAAANRGQLVLKRSNENQRLQTINIERRMSTKFGTHFTLSRGQFYLVGPVYEGRTDLSRRLPR